jgi:uncharacterized membrane protein
MIESIYQILTNFGYTHPLHPTLTHVPIGMVMGAFLFALAGLVFRREVLTRTARHCMVLGLLVLPPTLVLGLMDWLHFYAGAWLFPIKMKMVLGGILLLLLILAVVYGFLAKTFSKVIMALYVLSLLTVVGLGFFGGELVYGTQKPAGDAIQGPAAEGAMVFQQNCSACHLPDSTANKIGPGLKGVFKLDEFPVSGQPVSEDNFKKQLITPFDKMPPFGHLPSEQVDALIAYLKTL